MTRKLKIKRTTYDAEVEFRVNKDIGWFKVAMDDTFRMNVFKRVNELSSVNTTGILLQLALFFKEVCERPIFTVIK